MICYWFNDLCENDSSSYNEVSLKTTSKHLVYIWSFVEERNAHFLHERVDTRFTNFQEQ